jgi:poly-gamma-glutamate capsule biosynthesis protein CapA/YwtB (metallophosphatase superfamily)
MNSAQSSIQIALVGDMILDDDEPGRLFDLSRVALQRADLLVGQVEVPHSLRGKESHFDVPAPFSDPVRLRALGGAGFHIATLAGNHIYDLGWEGIEDTLNALHAQDIQTTGAGSNLADARRAAILKCDGIRVGVLSYNCVGPRESKASANKPGAAFVDVITHYESQSANPGGPPGKIYSFPDPDSLEQMEKDIAALRPSVDFVIVALHKGIVHLPAVLAMYERIVSKAAVEAGAQLVVGHHAHICRGVETINGCPVFHGLGNFVTVTDALSVDQANPERRAWAKKRKEMFGFEPDPEYPKYPFHPQSRNTLIAVCDVDKAGLVRAGFLPCWINGKSQPEVHGRDEVGERVTEYIRHITREAGLDASFEWDGGQVTFWRR